MAGIVLPPGSGSVCLLMNWIPRRVLPAVALALFLSAAYGDALDVDARTATVRHAAMGTEFVFTLYPPNADMQSEEVLQITEEAFAAVDRLERHISTWIPESDVSWVNQNAAKEPVALKPDVLEILLDARRFYRETDGAFDVTVGPLIDLWGFYKGQGHLPSDEELKKALEKVGLNKVEVDEKAETVHFTHPEMRLDFGGIGKGLALDRAQQVLKKQKVKSAILHAGTSTVVTLGKPPGAAGWTVRVRSPYNDTKAYVDEVQIFDESLSTSSSSEQFMELDGKKYSHIFDPRTGMPVEREVLSATAIAPTGMQSDALSTSFFVMGVDKTRAYCEAHPEVRAILVVLDNGTLKPLRINFPG